MAGTDLLVIDDEPHVTLVVEHTGRLHGFSVASARSLEEGRTFLLENQIKVLLLDVSLPDGSGLDFLAEMRKDERLANMKVIVLTGAGYDELVERADLLGAEVVTKPFSPTKLSQKVEELMANKTSQ